MSAMLAQELHLRVVIELPLNRIAWSSNPASGEHERPSQ